jgi:hypothetical protein
MDAETKKSFRTNFENIKFSGSLKGNDGYYYSTTIKPTGSQLTKNRTT